MTELQTRSLEIRSVNKEKREVEGIAAPFGEVAEQGYYRESFAETAFDDLTDSDLPTVFYSHDHLSGGMPIGKVIEARSTDEGLAVRIRLSKTAKAEEVYTLVKDKVLNRFSVGFLPVENRIEDDIIVRTKVELKEVSIVALPAYKQAEIVEVRAENTNTKELETIMETATEKDLELRDELANLKRELGVLKAEGLTVTEGNKGSQFRSFGEWAKALVAGNEAAHAEYRAFADDHGTTADSVLRDSWWARAVKVIEERRRLTKFFASGVLPDQGMKVEWPVLDDDTLDAEIQLLEGDDLVSGNLSFKTADATIRTVGGTAKVSRQTIERSSVAYLDQLWNRMLTSYARRSEALVRLTLVSAEDTHTDTLAAHDAEGWLGLVIDANDAIENATGYTADALVMSSDVYKAVSTLTDGSGRPLFVINGDGSNTVGGAAVAARSGNIAGVPFLIDPALPSLGDDSAFDQSLYVAAKPAITSFESGPFRLQDENVVNLSKDFSVYGYHSVGVTDALAIVRVDASAVLA